MDVLIITNSFPYPLNVGGRQAQFNMLDALRHKIHFHLMYLDHPMMEDSVTALQTLWPEVKFYPILCENQVRPPKTLIQRVVNRIWKWIYKPERIVIDTEYANSTLADNTGTIINRRFIDQLDDFFARQHIDIIQTEFYPMLDVVYCLPIHIPKIYVQHEIRFVRNLLERKTMSSDNHYLDYAVAKLKAEEITALNKYDAVIALTQTDKEKMQEAGVESPVFVSSAAVCPLKHKVDEYTFNGTLTFVGHGGHPPNKDGLLWFLNNIWPKLLEHTSLCLKVIGIWQDDFVQYITQTYQRVVFTGFVDDLAEALQDTVMIVPLRVGSGMRMKILDAANCGIPFITTSVGVEGLCFEHNHDCLIADTADAFFDAIIRLADDSDLRNRLISNSVRIYQNNYSLDALADQRYCIYKELLRVN